MSPPGEYCDNTVGLPLPGVRIRFAELGELQVAGPYVARYLEEGPPGTLPPPQDPVEEYWLPTGDLFKTHLNGHLEIVDRLKDICRNSQGQTVAPQVRLPEVRAAGGAGTRRPSRQSATGS